MAHKQNEPTLQINKEYMLQMYINNAEEINNFSN